MADLRQMKAYIHEWADERGVYADFNGTIGFGRPSVGITDGQCYVALGDVGAPRGEVAPDAYHKDRYLAVLLQDDGPEYEERAIRQLYGWLKQLAADGVTVAERPHEPGSIAREIYPYSQESVLVRSEAISP